MANTVIEYIEVDNREIARIIGSRIKVMHLIALQKTGSYTTEQLCIHYPHLKPAQIDAALAYYHDHQALVDTQIETSARFAEEMRARHPNRRTREEWLSLLTPEVRDRIISRSPDK